MDGVCSGHAIVVLVFLVRLPRTVFTMLTCGWCLFWACYSCARLPCSSVPDSVYWMVSVLLTCGLVDGVCSGHAIVVLVFLVRMPRTVFTMLTCRWCLFWACYSCARLPCSSAPDSVYYVNLWMVSVLGML